MVFNIICNLFTKGLRIIGKFQFFDAIKEVYLLDYFVVSIKSDKYGGKVSQLFFRIIPV